MRLKDSTAVLFAMALPGFAMAGQIFSPPADLYLNPLIFSGVNGTVTQTDTFYVITQSELVVIPKLTPYVSAMPFCQPGRTCNSYVSEYISAPWLPNYIRATSTYHQTADPSGNVFDFSSNAGDLMLVNLAPGEYSITLAITSVGDPHFATPASNEVGLDLQVIGGQATDNEFPTTNNVPEPGTLILGTGVLAIFFGLDLTFIRRSRRQVPVRDPPDQYHS